MEGNLEQLVKGHAAHNLGGPPHPVIVATRKNKDYMRIIEDPIVL